MRETAREKIVALRAEKSSLKAALRDFDAQFTAATGRPPAKQDKEHLRPMYARYHELKAMIATVEGAIEGTGAEAQGAAGTPATVKATTTADTRSALATPVTPAVAAAPTKQPAGSTATLTTPGSKGEPITVSATALRAREGSASGGDHVRSSSGDAARGARPGSVGLTTPATLPRRDSGDAGILPSVVASQSAATTVEGHSNTATRTDTATSSSAATPAAPAIAASTARRPLQGGPSEVQNVSTSVAHHPTPLVHGGGGTHSLVSNSSNAGGSSGGGILVTPGRGDASASTPTTAAPSLSADGRSSHAPETGGGGGDAAMRELRAEKRRLQATLRDFEREFEAREGRKVTYVRDIQPVIESYTRYKMLKSLTAAEHTVPQYTQALFDM